MNWKGTDNFGITAQTERAKSRLLSLDSRRRCSLAAFGRPEHTRYSVLVQPDGTLVLTPIEESS